MPNYSLVMNSKFQPFSFERYIQPLQIYGQAYREQEDALAELDTKASILEGMTNEQTDPIAHAQYKKYAEDLRSQANLLATEGLNPTSRQAMLNLRGRYAKEIIPIEQAYKKRSQLAEEQRKAGNSMIYDMDASTTSLDKFIANPELQYKSIDRKDLLNRSMAEFGSLAKSLEAYGKGQPVDNYTNTFIQQHGITRKAASDFIEAVRSGNISSADPTLKAIYNNLYNSTRVSEWNSPTAQEAVKNTILEGVVAGIGQTTINTFQDVAKVKALEHSYAIKRMEKQAELDAEKAERVAKVKAEQEKNERLASIDTRKRYDITQDDRIKKYKRLGIISEDANGNLSVDRKAFEKFNKMTPAEMKQYSADLEAQIAVIDDMTKHSAKGGQRNPNYVGWITYDDARNKFPELGFPAGKTGLSINDQAKLRKHLNNIRTSLQETKNDFDAGSGVAQLYSDFADLGGISVNDVKTNVDLFERALNANIGDRYTMNQNLYYTVDETQSKSYLNSAKNKQGSLRGLPQYYLDERGGFTKPSNISTKDLDASEIHNVIVRKGKDGKTHAYYELTTKDGEDVALQLPDDLAKSLIQYSDDLDAAKHNYLVYQQTLEQDKRELPYRARLEHNGQVALPDRSDMAVTYSDLDNILNKFALAAADLAKVNKTEPVKMQP